jgi:hypothetical protein
VLPLAGREDRPKGEGKAPAKGIKNSVDMELVLIPRGTFLMGSPKDEEGRRDDDEGPQHEVRITRPFYLGVYAVTQAEYQKVMGKNPSWFCKDNFGKDKVEGLDTGRFPVEHVSWADARKFCDELSKWAQEKKRGRLYRLPSEAEWEYACRAGTKTPFHFGKSASSTQANFYGGSPYGGAARGLTWGGPARWAVTGRIAGASTTCTATSGSGARTGMARTTTEAALKQTRKGRKGGPAACCAAAAGASPAGAVAPPAAAGASPATATAPSASGSPATPPRPGSRGGSHHVGDSALALAHWWEPRGRW